MNAINLFFANLVIIVIIVAVVLHSDADRVLPKTDAFFK